MALTYTRARERPALRHTAAAADRGGRFALCVTALVSAMALALCYVGRMQAFTASSNASVPIVDLTANPTENQLAPITALAFASPADARFAAHELAAALGRGAAGPLPNVGALTRLQVPLSTVERARGLDVYAARARAATTSAASTDPAMVALFTTADVGLMKPALVARTTSAHRTLVFWCVLGLLGSFQAISLVWQLRGVRGDRLMLSAVHFLVTLGAMVMLSRPDPLRDTVLLVRFTEGVLVASAVCALVSLLNVRTSAVLQLSYLALAVALALSLLLALFGSGPGSSGAKVNLGAWQPGEFVRLLLIVFLAGYLGRRWELLRQVREDAWGRRRLPQWLHVPRLEHLAPMLGGVGLTLVLFFALRDLGPALLISLVWLLMLSAARAGAGAIVTGLVLLAGGFYAGHALELSSTLSARVAMWQSPWANAVRGGDQIAHAAWAMAAGAVTGVGSGLGDTRYLPAGHTDLVVPAIGEDLGLIGLLAATAAAGVVAWRGFRAARGAGTDAAFFLAFGLTVSLVLPMLVMAAGTLGLIPLTGVVTPFLSYGGSAMVANFAAVGLLAAIASTRDASLSLQPFHAPVRWVATGLTVCAVVIAGGWTRIQAAADDVLVRPQLSRQADGGLRYQYNPRVLDAARLLPRGSIRDRRDVPLAADAATVREFDAELTRMHITPAEACRDVAARCYPLGGRTFHLLGDSGTRLNWAATNSSYVERDAESRLRGFDDHASSVETDAADGERTLSLRRDYRDLVPLVRHRWNPGHPDVAAIRSRPREVQLTIDARLQMQVSSIVARAAAASGIRKAAVVVVHAGTGEVLASVSYPWPDRSTAADVPEDQLLDRARYGRYPPGSTFKLVTAAAALRLDPALSRLPFVCTRLPENRVGVRLPGHRPIRDDVRDRVPHGRLTLGAGLVHSCNAYFAQLAVRLGTHPLARTAEAAGIVFPDARDGSDLADYLPHAGYGQGGVLTTPLRMARVAAAIASDGMIREPPVVRGGEAAEPKLFLPAASARVLAQFMRDAVTGGTGRALRGHTVPIAGKTGTAQVDGAASHAWFVGFAPAGRPAADRIAFAVLLEHAGYGGAGAAAVAGQVVTAAAGLELIK
jgi:cell division protein FtsW (lipid II flippase)